VRHDRSGKLHDRYRERRARGRARLARRAGARLAESYFRKATAMFDWILFWCVLIVLVIGVIYAVAGGGSDDDK
jgi:hypothetical protein